MDRPVRVWGAFGAAVVAVLVVGCAPAVPENFYRGDVEVGACDLLSDEVIEELVGPRFVAVEQSETLVLEPGSAFARCAYFPPGDPRARVTVALQEVDEEYLAEDRAVEAVPVFPVDLSDERVENAYYYVGGGALGSTGPGLNVIWREDRLLSAAVVYRTSETRELPEARLGLRMAMEELLAGADPEMLVLPEEES